MEAVKQWAFSVCSAMVACGIARMLLPGGRTEKVFRTTISIFFLCCLLSPMLLRLPAIRIEMESAPQSGIEERARRLEAAVSSQADGAARWEVAKIVGEKLDEMGINYYDVTINMNNDGQRGPEVESVEIILDMTHEKEHRAIQSELARALDLTIRLGYRTAEEGTRGGG